LIARLALRRLLEFVPVVVFVYTITFALFQATPGSPFQTEGRQLLSDRTLERVEEHYGLNDPWHEQYLRYAGNALQGDFGPSYHQQGRDVSDVINDALPVTLQLAFAAMVVALALGIPLGVIAAVKQNTKLDYLATSTSMLGICVPSYVTASLLVAVLAIGISVGDVTIGGQWLPSGGWDGLFSEKIIIPVIALAAYPTAELARFTRAAVLDVISQDYVRTARAKGLGESHVIMIHTFRNALIPVVTVLAFEFSFLLAGSVFVESVTNVPGMGRVTVTALTQRDQPVIMATVLLFAMVVLVVNFLVDVAYLVLDPRIRYT
jgi:ABC-type dipeptide/oligopeptide/nickel transport system permease component